MPDILTTGIKSRVTCLKFVDDRILAGIAGDLHLLCLDSTNAHKHLFKLTVFPVQNIYGILNKNEHLLVFGGKKLALLNFCKDIDTITKIYEWNADDWVLDVSWMSNGLFAAIITAHNTVIQYDLCNRASIYKVSSEERCILYSAKVMIECPSDIIVLAGTVFQEIVIWTSSGLCSSGNGVPVLHKLRGHKGVIFHVDYDAQSNSICSTSDDRTVRIWSVQFSHSFHTNAEKWRTAEINLKHSIFGHTARVWRSCFLSNNRIVSIGEDSFICIWDEFGNCAKQWTGHQGGAIWSVDCSEDLGFVMTGGNDCGISLWPLCDFEPPAPLNINLFHNEDPVTPKILSLTAGGEVVTITECGCIMVYANAHWKVCYSDKRFSSYCLQSMSPTRRQLALGSIKGDIIIFAVDDGELKKMVDYNGVGKKIFSLVWVSETVFITCESEGLILLWELKKSQGSINIEIMKKCILPPSKERWITTALLLPNYLLCGDRMGSVHLYSIGQDNNILIPDQSLLKLHGARGVSCLLCINGKITSAGRDGTIRRLSVSNSNLQLISTHKLKMDWATNVEDTKVFGLIVTGFHNVHFVVWSMVEQRHLLKIDCGGGHRSWDCMIDTDYLVLTFIKNKDVHYFHNPLSKISCSSPLVGYHTKTINTGCILPISNCGEVILLTGSEDTTLRTSKILGYEIFKSNVTLRNHISSVRTVYSLPSPSSCGVYVFSAGGRGQLKVWKFSLDDNGDTFAVELASHMVRNQSNRHWLKALPLPDPETRHMDLTAVEMNPQIILIIAGCSDGMLRFFEFDTIGLTLTMCNVCELDQHCILKVFSFKFKESVVAVSMTTDGKASFWNAGTVLSQGKEDPPVRPFKQFRIHELGINSSAFHYQSEYLILTTGSDDTSVKVNAFSLGGGDSVSILCSWYSKELHNCQVTGAVMTQKYILTVGLDQKLNMLKWTFNNCMLDVQLICKFVSCIPDIHGLLSWSPNDQISEMNICIFGEGFQLLSIVDKDFSEKN